MFDREQPLPRIVVGASSLSSVAHQAVELVSLVVALQVPIAYPAGLSLKPLGTKPVFT
jgi:hypothetical protein